MDLEKCIEKGHLQRMPPDEELTQKELMESRYDLESAREAIEKEDFKWTIVKSYYSMFHSARGLLFSIGLKERGHFAVTVALEDLYKKGKIESKYVAQFSSAMSAREDADYRYTYSRETAEAILEAAEEFTERIKEMLKDKI